jgi:hypothetical protein
VICFRPRGAWTLRTQVSKARMLVGACVLCKSESGLVRGVLRGFFNERQLKENADLGDQVVVVSMETRRRDLHA